MSTDQSPATPKAPYRLHSDSREVVGNILIAVASLLSKPTTFTSSAVTQGTGIFWGSTKVNVTNSHGGHPARENETSRLAIGTSGVTLNVIHASRSCCTDPTAGGFGFGVGIAVGCGVAVGGGIGVAVGCGVAVGNMGDGVGTVVAGGGKTVGCGDAVGGGVGVGRGLATARDRVWVAAGRGAAAGLVVPAGIDVLAGVVSPSPWVQAAAANREAAATISVAVNAPWNFKELAPGQR